MEIPGLPAAVKLAAVKLAAVKLAAVRLPAVITSDHSYHKKWLDLQAVHCNLDSYAWA